MLLLRVCRFKIIAFFAFFLLYFITSKAQNGSFDYGKYETPQAYRSTTKFGIASLLWGHVPFTSEYKVLHDFVNSPYTSTQLGLSLFSGGPLLRSLNNNQPPTQGDKYTMFGYRLQGTQKFYLNKNSYAPEGWYIGPHISYSYCRFSTQNLLQVGYFVQLQQINVCGVVGYQKISNRLVTDFYLGLGYKNNTDVVINGGSGLSRTSIDFYKDAPFYSGNVRFMLGVNLGFASPNR
jgi:hypothetical protein